MTAQNTTYKGLTKAAIQCQIEERRRQVMIHLAQGMTEIEIGKKLGVDNSTISKDITALKLISQQFIYDITKSDFSFYYRQCLELAKFVLKKQVEIANKTGAIEDQDVRRARILSDILNTVATINEYYKTAPMLHQTPMHRVMMEDRLGIRPGTKAHKLTPEEEDQLIEDMRKDDEEEYAELEKDNLKDLQELEKSNFKDSLNFKPSAIE